MTGDGREGRKRALIISISDYSKLRPLDFCKNDGEEMYNLLKSLGYEISDSNKLIGEVKWDTMREAILKFFGDRTIKAKDTLLFYFSGHGVPDGYGDNYLATSEIDPDAPDFRGFSFDEITKMMYKSVSTKIITMLDCCYSGAARIAGPNKASENAAAKLAREAIDNKSKILEEGQGKCLLAASMATQEAYGLKEKGHSIFTYYLLEGLRGGNGESVDKDGRVTPDTLGTYVYDKVTDVAPDQKPIKKVEEAGNIILAYYPKLKTITSEALLALLVEGKIEQFNKIRTENSNLTLDFSRQSLHRLHLSDANLSNANLTRTNLTETDLEGADLTNADLDRADLEGANLYRAKLTNASLESANLSYANLTKATLTKANLLRANLSNANLYGGDLQQANLLGADLRGAKLTSTNLLGADLRAAIFDDFKVKQPEEVKEVKPEEVKEVKQPIIYQPVSQLSAKKTDDEVIMQSTSHSQIKEKIGIAGPPKVFPQTKASSLNVSESPRAGGSKKIVLILAVSIGIVIAGIVSVYFSMNAPEQQPSTAQQEVTPAPQQPLPSEQQVTPAPQQPLPSEQQVTPAFVKKWTVAGSPSDIFGNPLSLDLDSSGNVYVTNAENNRVVKYDNDGNVITDWGSYGSGKGQFSIPYGIAIDSSDNVYVVDSNNNRTEKFNSDGKYIKQWGSGGSGNGQFAWPEGIAIDSSSGNVYVADTYNNRIQKFDHNGKFITSWGTNGTNQGDFDAPSDVSVDSSGNVYVADTWNNRIQKFDHNGKFINSWGSYSGLNSPNGVTLDSSGNVYVADTWNNETQLFDENGKFISSWGGYGSENGQFNRPIGIALDSSRNIYVADTWNNRIQVFKQMSPEHSNLNIVNGNTYGYGNLSTGSYSNLSTGSYSNLSTGSYSNLSTGSYSNLSGLGGNMTNYVGNMSTGSYSNLSGLGGNMTNYVGNMSAIS